jgi:hypothetical protein
MIDHPRKRDRRRRPALAARLALGTGLAAAAVGLAGGAGAQVIVQREDFIPVLDRPHPQWDPLGISVGQFLVSPRVSLGVEYDDNILDVPTGVQSDIIYQVNPEITAVSNWNQNEVDFSAAANLTRYDKYYQQDTDQYTISASGILNIRHDWLASLQFYNLRAEIPRSSDAYVANSIIPLLYDETYIQVFTQKKFIDFELTGSVTFQNYNYTNGLALTGPANHQTSVVVNEDFRNRDTTISYLRGDYTISPSLDLFILERVADSSYPDTTGRNQVTTETLIGPNFELGHVLQAEIGVGYLTNQVANPQAAHVQSADWLAQVIYLPTPLITLNLLADQRVVDSGLPMAPAYLLKDVGFEIDYELLRNLILVSKTSALWYDYQGISRRDRYLNASVGATYYVNRLLGINLIYAHDQRISTGSAAGPGFHTNSISLTLVLQR